MTSQSRAKLVVYQVNTWVWLDAIGRQHGTYYDLNTVPDSALEELARPGVTMIWMMGVWQRSPFGRMSALRYKHEYRHALPDVTDEDVIGSAYAIHDYRVDDRLGGNAALANFRRRLAARGLRLMLDFVPNHVSADHRWTIEHPEYIVQGRSEDLIHRPNDFFRIKTVKGDVVLAHGKDPYFAGWSDTAQLNVFNPDLRREMAQIAVRIAGQCDALRCDMAMLLFDDVFSSTWRGYVGERLAHEYWREIIPVVKSQYPEFMFAAEVYWQREYDAIQQGFDYAYDKRFYDRVIAGDVAQIRLHLLANFDYQRHMMRFIENHDERRAYESLGARRSFPAATLICTLPGAALIHEGQLVGRTKKLPVQIKRQPDEPLNRELEAYYLRLLKETRDPVYSEGNFFLFHVNPAGSDPSHNNLLAYGWSIPGDGYRLIVVNLTQHRSIGIIRLSNWTWLDGKTWRLYDVADGEEYTRHGGEMTHEGLYIDLQPYESHVFRFAVTGEPITTAEFSAIQNEPE